MHWEQGHAVRQMANVGPSGGAAERGLGRALLGGGPAQGKKKGCIWGLRRAESGWTLEVSWGAAGPIRSSAGVINLEQ